MAMALNKGPARIPWALCFKIQEYEAKNTFYVIIKTKSADLQWYLNEACEGEPMAMSCTTKPVYKYNA